MCACLQDPITEWGEGHVQWRVTKDQKVYFLGMDVLEIAFFNLGPNSSVPPFPLEQLQGVMDEMVNGLINGLYVNRHNRTFPVCHMTMPFDIYLTEIETNGPLQSVHNFTLSIKSSKKQEHWLTVGPALPSAVTLLLNFS